MVPNERRRLGNAIEAYLEGVIRQPAVAAIPKQHGRNLQQVLPGPRSGSVPHLQRCCGWHQSICQPQVAAAAHQLSSCPRAARAAADLSGSAACDAHSAADAAAGRARGWRLQQAEAVNMCMQRGCVLIDTSGVSWYRVLLLVVVVTLILTVIRMLLRQQLLLLLVLVSRWHSRQALYHLSQQGVLYETELARCLGRAQAAGPAAAAAIAAAAVPAWGTTLQRRRQLHELLQQGSGGRRRRVRDCCCGSILHRCAAADAIGAAGTPLGSDR